MKKIFIFTLFIPVTLLYAQTTTQNTATSSLIASSTPAQSTATTVANINLLNVKATKNATSSYSVSFTLTNTGGVSASTYYTLSLVEKNGAIVSVQTFSKPAIVEPNKPVNIVETFYIPKGITGTYSLRVQALTDAGLPVGFGTVENITMKDIELVKIASCVPDQKSYKVNQILTLLCTITETKKGSLTATDVGGYIVSSKVFYNNEPVEKLSALSEIVKGKASIEIKNLNIPGTYTIRTTLQERSGALVGKETDTLFTVNGTLVTILNLLLDKNTYMQGEDAIATIALQVKTEGTSSPLSIASTLVGTDGDCAASNIEELRDSTSATLSIPIIKNCNDPTLTLRILDSETKVLAEKTLSVKSPRIAPPAPVTPTSTPLFSSEKIPLYGGVAAGIIILLALGEFFVFRKMRQISIETPLVVIPESIPQTTTQTTSIQTPTETIPQQQITPEIPKATEML